MDDRTYDPPRRRLSQAEARQQTRAHLLAAAAHVFAKKGFAGASLEEIAERAGYTTGALYYHFANKDELFLELVRTGWPRTSARRFAAAARALRHVETDPAAAYDALGRALVAYAERDGDLVQLSAEFWLQAVRNPEAMALVSAQLRQQARELEPSVALAMQATAAGDDITPGEMTTVALVLFDGLARRRRVDPESVPDDLFARVLRRLLAERPHAARGPMEGAAARGYAAEHTTSDRGGTDMSETATPGAEEEGPEDVRPAEEPEDVRPAEEPEDVRPA